MALIPIYKYKYMSTKSIFGRPFITNSKLWLLKLILAEGQTVWCHGAEIIYIYIGVSLNDLVIASDVEIFDFWFSFNWLFPALFYNI